MEMSHAEKDAVDLPLQQQKEAVAVAQNEIKTNEVCANNTLAEITAYWKGPGASKRNSRRRLRPSIRRLPPWRPDRENRPHGGQGCPRGP